MTSSAAAAFSTVDRHLNEFAFGSRAVEDGGRLRGNLAMGEFVLRYVGLPLVADHIVIEHHEEVSRKAYFRPSAESQTKACASDMLLRGGGAPNLPRARQSMSTAVDRLRIVEFYVCRRK